MRIDSSFAEADIGKIKEGQKVRFTVDAFPDRSFTGEVQQIRMNPTTTQNVVTYNVRVSLANPDHILLPGMTAYVNIGVAESRDVLLVPNAALRFKPAEADEAASANGAQSGASTGGQGARNGEARGRGKKREGNSGRVYVVDGRTIKPVQVQLGITDNRNTEVVGGDLKEGDTLVVSEAPTAATKPSSVGMRLF